MIDGRFIFFSIKISILASGLVCLCNTNAYSQAHGYGMPVEGLGRYGEFRRVMLRNGFIPVPQAMHVDAYIEISCGNTMCSADWLGPDRRKINFGIWFSYKGNKQIFYLAPQAE
jgi:hypothetical protein